MVFVPVLCLVAALFIPNGYAIKCNFCQAASNSNPNGCQTPNEVTCPMGFDGCFTVRGGMEINIPGGGVAKATIEIRNCSVRAVMCTEPYRDLMCGGMNATGYLTSCNFSCCGADLCNDGTNPPDSGLNPPQASNLSCYECSPEELRPGGSGTPVISCSTPRQRKCGDIFPGVPLDRCMTVKALVKHPNTSALVEQEYRNCSHSSMMCTNDMFCNNMNSTGEVVTCNTQCCEGDLCNGMSQPTTGPSTPGPSTSNPSTSGPSPSGPKAGQTPLAVSGILAIMSIVMALLFK